MKRVIVTGSRTCLDKELVYRILDEYMPDEGILVHGDCPNGVDALARQWAEDVGYVQERHPAEWKRPDGSVNYGAGHKRNREMAMLGADLCIAIWDGESPGTEGMIRNAIMCGIRVYVLPSKPR